MKNLVVTALLLLCATYVSAQPKADYRIIPLPQSVQTDTTRCFTLAAGAGISYDAGDPETSRIAQWLKQYVEESTGLTLALTPDSKKAAISLTKQQPKAKKGQPQVQLDEGITNSAYTITVGKKGIQLTAACNEGLFRAMQTLRKSLPLQQASGQGILFPYTSIADQPRFAYRGVHLDCARHYFPIETVKTYIDLMALHGCNQFHWHITEDQGWRFEVKALPDLARKGSIRKQTVLGRNTGVYDGQPYGEGLYYTQEQCREIVNYAAQRYINVIPEIDLPGHMLSALHVYPNLGCTGGPYEVWPHWGVSADVLCAGNPETMQFIKTVLGELCDVFPSKYVHIGGDECPKSRWQNCAKCQAKARELGLVATPEHSIENQLQTYINREVEQFLAERGRDIIGWDETLDGGLTPNAIVMSWRGTEGGIAAARQKHRVIMSPNSYCYIDYYQQKDQWGAPLGIGGYLPVSKVYSYEPLAEELTTEEQSYILGPQVNLWTEYVGYPQHVFYMLLPRLDAISEVQWTQADKKDLDDFRTRLPHMLQMYDRMGVNYCHTIE